MNTTDSQCAISLCLRKPRKAAALGVQINTDPISWLALSDAACTVIYSFTRYSLADSPRHYLTSTLPTLGIILSSISIFSRGSYAGKAPMSRRKWGGVMSYEWGVAFLPKDN